MSYNEAELEAFIAQNRQKAIRWASHILGQRDTIIFDTETTGLDREAEVVEIAMIDITGSTLLNTLVKPVGEISAEARQFHGLTTDLLAGAPTFADIYHLVRDQLRPAAHLVAYNVGFHWRMIEQSCRVHGLPLFKPDGLFSCAMKSYAAYRGEWNSYNQSFTQQKLEGKHRALDDALLILNIIHEMARGEQPEILETKLCPSCHSPVAQKANFCLQCGYKLTDTVRQVGSESASVTSDPTQTMEKRSRSLVNLRGCIIPNRHSPDGHVIANFNYLSGKTVISGKMDNVDFGDWLEIEGYWSSHPVYESFFEVVRYQHQLPATLLEFESFLGGGAFKLGPVMARRIITRFGAQTLEILENDVKKLGLVDGCGSKRVKMIAQSWQEYKRKLSKVDLE